MRMKFEKEYFSPKGVFKLCFRIIVNNISLLTKLENVKFTFVLKLNLSFG